MPICLGVLPSSCLAQHLHFFTVTYFLSGRAFIPPSVRSPLPAALRSIIVIPSELFTACRSTERRAALELQQGFVGSAVLCCAGICDLPSRNSQQSFQAAPSTRTSLYTIQQCLLLRLYSSRRQLCLCLCLYLRTSDALSVSRLLMYIPVSRPAWF